MVINYFYLLGWSPQPYSQWDENCLSLQNYQILTAQEEKNKEKFDFLGLSYRLRTSDLSLFKYFIPYKVHPAIGKLEKHELQE